MDREERNEKTPETSREDLSGFKFRELAPEEDERYIADPLQVSGEDKSPQDASEDGIKERDNLSALRRFIGYVFLAIALFILLIFGIFSLNNLRKQRDIASGKIPGTNIVISRSYYNYISNVFGDTNILMSLVTPVLIYYQPDGSVISPLLEDIPSVERNTMGLDSHGNSWVKFKFRGDLKWPNKTLIKTDDFVYTYQLIMSSPLSLSDVGRETRAWISNVIQTGDTVILTYRTSIPYPYFPFNFVLPSAEDRYLSTNISNNIMLTIRNVRHLSKFFGIKSDHLIKEGTGKLRVISIQREDRLNVFFLDTDQLVWKTLNTWSSSVKRRSLYILTLSDIYYLMDSINESKDEKGKPNLDGMLIHSYPSFSSVELVLSEKLPLPLRKAIYSKLISLNWEEKLRIGGDTLEELSLEGDVKLFRQESFLPPTHYAYSPVGTEANHYDLNLRGSEKLTLIYPENDKLLGDIAQIISRELKSLSINVILKPLPFNDYSSRKEYHDILRKGKFQLALLELTIPPRIRPQTICGKGGLVKTSDEELQDLAVRISEEGYSELSRRLYASLQKRVADQALIVPLFNKPVLIIYPKKWKDKVEDLGGTSPIWLYLYYSRTSAKDKGK